MKEYITLWGLPKIKRGKSAIGENGVWGLGTKIHRRLIVAPCIEMMCGGMCVCKCVRRAFHSKERLVTKLYKDTYCFTRQRV